MTAEPGSIEQAQDDEARLALESEIVEAMYEAGFSTGPTLDAFSTWLLVGSASAAAFTLGNAGNLTPVIGADAVAVGGVILSLSCLCGVIAKVFSVRFSISENVRAHLRNAGLTDRIRTTGVDQARLVEQFVRPLTFLQRRRARRTSAELASGRAGALDHQIDRLNSVNFWASCQAILAMLFLFCMFAFVGLRAGQ